MFASRASIGVMGLGDVPAFCAPGFVGPLTPDEVATCQSAATVDTLQLPDNSVVQIGTTGVSNITGTPGAVPQTTPVISSTVVFLAAGAALLFFVVMAAKR